MIVEEVGADIRITLSRTAATDLSHGAADLLCWIRGFNCAYGGSDGPLGDEALRRFKEKLDSVLFPDKGLPF